MIIKKDKPGKNKKKKIELEKDAKSNHIQIQMKPYLSSPISQNAPTYLGQMIVSLTNKCPYVK